MSANAPIARRDAPHLRWIAGLGCCALSAIALAQSSAGYRLQGGEVVASQSSAAPSSPGFRAEGSMGAAGVSGVASSANYVATTGGTTPPQVADPVFANGFEGNPAAP